MIVRRLLIGSHAVLLSLLACATTPVFAQTQTNSESTQSAIKGSVDGIGASDVLPDAGVEKAKTITITEEVLLPEIDLGRIEPGNAGHFLIGIDTKLPLRSECVQVAKAEPMEVFPHQVGLHRTKIVLQQFPKLNCLVGCQITASLQDAPP